MTNQHPITPLPELVQQWASDSPIQANDENWAYELYIAHQAAQWGSDQELEACCEHLKRSMSPRATIDYLLAARRPKPPTLKEQALEALNQADEGLNESEWQQRFDTIRRALEQLDD